MSEFMQQNEGCSWEGGKRAAWVVADVDELMTALAGKVRKWMCW